MATERIGNAYPLSLADQQVVADPLTVAQVAGISGAQTLAHGTCDDCAEGGPVGSSVCECWQLVDYLLKPFG